MSDYIIKKLKCINISENRDGVFDVKFYSVKGNVCYLLTFPLDLEKANQFEIGTLYQLKATDNRYMVDPCNLTYLNIKNHGTFSKV